jgi:hypothetical protein
MIALQYFVPGVAAAAQVGFELVDPRDGGGLRGEQLLDRYRIQPRATGRRLSSPATGL